MPQNAEERKDNGVQQSFGLELRLLQGEEPNSEEDIYCSLDRLAW